MKPSKKNLEKPLVRSDVLPSLRRFLETLDHLGQLIGPIAEFHVVVDANILIQDILWILGKRKNPSARTALQESIIAGTIIAYATPAVIGEVEEKLPALVAERRLSQTDSSSEWIGYKKMLRIMKPNHAKLAKYLNGQDPDDAPTLALADTLSACGILSCDSDIKAMGGKVIPLEFVVQARDYSRKAAVSVSIQIGGYVLVVGTGQAIQVLMAALKHGVAWFRGLPDGVKLLIVVALIFVALYPKSRNSITAWLKTLGGGMHGVFPQILQIIACLHQMASENRAVPPTPPQAESR